jgi:sphingomyelin phosphodiesterase
VSLPIHVVRYTFNWYNVLNHRDVGVQGEVSRMKNFVLQTLQKATNANEKVILLSHHPVGGADFLVSESRWYQYLALKYKDTIVLQPTGHTHLDEFRLIYEADVPQSVVYVSSSVSGGGTNNPSMRVYYLNSTTFQLVDYDQFYLDLAPPNAAKSEKSSTTELIKLLYSAKSAYGLPDLSPASWHQLTVRFQSDETLFKTHLSHSDAEAKDRYTCLSVCKERYICRLRNADYDKYSECAPSLADALKTITWSPGSPRTTKPWIPPSRATSFHGLHGTAFGSIAGIVLAYIATDYIARF